MKKLFYIGVLILFLFACAGFDTWYQADLVVSGTANDININFKNSQGDREQVNNISPPWNFSFSARKGFEVICIVQNNQETGTISIELYKDGQLLTSAFSDTAFAEISIQKKL